jgi:LPS sulfotransferase NodH
MGLRPDHIMPTQPSAFVVLAAARTGSTLLGNGLADHRGILYYGEVFHDNLLRRAAEAARKTVGVGVVRNLPNGFRVCTDAQDGYAYLVDLFQPRCRADAIGIKLLYHHARSGPTSSAWRFLQMRPDIRVVHLRRSDWLASFVSLERAKRSGCWHTTTPPEVTPFSVSPADCLKWFQDLTCSQASIERLIANKPIIDVQYEELTTDFSGTISRIYSYLGLTEIHVPVPRLAKVATVPPWIELDNYSELRLCFRRSKFARFFPDKSKTHLCSLQSAAPPHSQY